jgi:futalosine hydrolase
VLALVFATARESRATLGPDHAEIEEGQWQEIQIYGHTCLQVLTGIGPINAAFVLGKVLATCPQLRGVINLGIGGSFDLDLLPLGTCVVAREEIWPEFGIKHAECVHARALGFPLGHTKSDAIWDRILIDPDEAALRTGLLLPSCIRRASFLTVAGVTSTKERSLFLQTMYHAGVENMEGFALALACATSDIPFLEIRTISNLVGPRDKATWQIKKAFASLRKILPMLFATPPPQGNI